MSQARPTEAGGSIDARESPGTDSTFTVQPGGAPEDAEAGTRTTLLSARQAGTEGPSPGSLPEVDPSRYSITGELARGGIGRILRARDLRLDRPVAIKEMLAPARGTEPRFVAEALVTARLQHPAIVPVYEAGRWPGGEPFYSMKLVSGRSLADVISERKTLKERLAFLPHVLAVAEAMFTERAPGGLPAEDSPRCKEPDCGKPVLAKELCVAHYHRARRAKPPAP